MSINVGDYVLVHKPDEINWHILEAAEFQNTIQRIRKIEPYSVSSEHEICYFDNKCHPDGYEEVAWFEHVFNGRGEISGKLLYKIDPPDGDGL